MEQSEAINELATALAKAQGVMSNVVADQKAVIQTQTKGTYSYNYADLASVLEGIRKPLSENGLCVVQGIEIGEGSAMITTQLLHTSGQWLRTHLAMPIPREATPQNIGSAITYGRRYSLTALIGLAAEDDDGKAASEKQIDQPRQATRPQPPTPAREVKELPKAAPKDAASPETETKGDPAIVRHQHMSQAAMKRWPLQPGETVAALIGPWLKNKGYGTWFAMSPEKQEEAIAKMQEEADLS